jgi:hypothetical protein
VLEGDLPAVLEQVNQLVVEWREEHAEPAPADMLEE